MYIIVANYICLSLVLYISSHDHTRNRIILAGSGKFFDVIFQIFQKHEVKRVKLFNLTHDCPYQSDKNEFSSKSPVTRLYKLFTEKNISELLSFFDTEILSEMRLLHPESTLHYKK